jgi:Flp pilus assembly protein TadD
VRPNVRVLAAAGALVALVGAVYLQAVRFDFVFDDWIYVIRNTPIHQGLSWAGFRWAFSGLHAAFWHPLTWLSHMLDITLYGMSPAGHHLSAVVLHAANAVLCFVVLRACTGVTWPAAFAAALFAIHPLRVESVVYVSERKDVLSALFWFLTLAQWRHYLRAPSRGRYLALLGVFALGLTAKPMLVTLPFVLLLLDFWPFDRLRRFSPRRAGRLILEKAPLLVLSVAASVLAFIAEKAYGALSPVDPFPLGVRLLNVLFSYAWYLVKTVWPSRLGAFYPHPGPNLPAWSLIAAAALLLAISFVAVRGLRRRPYLAVGWFWFLGTLVPVIGLVQLGDMGRADRFAYLPSVGLAIMLGWGAAAWAKGRPWRPAFVGSAAAAAVLVLAALTFRQAGFWRDGVTLFTRAVAVTDVNPLARYDLSVSLVQAGRREEALQQLRQILVEDPQYLPAYHDIGAFLSDAGRQQEALEILSAGLARFPGSYRLHFRLAVVLLKLGDAEAAATHLEEALRLKPAYAEAHVELGAIRGNQGRLEEAERHFQAALAADPASELARWNLRHLQEVRGGGAPRRP